MATFLKGIHGAYSGKVGNIVGSNWRSVDYVRSVSRPTNKPASEKQLAQREKFALATAFLGPMKDLLNLGYSDIQQGRSTGYNQGLRDVLKFAIAGIYPAFEIDYSKVRISRGALANLLAPQWTESAAQEITLTWIKSMSDMMGYNDDSVILLTYNKDKKYFNLMESATRADETLTLTFPPIYAGDTIVGWVFTGHRDGVKTSTSYYLGELTLS